MSEHETRTLHEELEIRVIALLTGELPESEADELEKILSVDESLADFRDRMAALIGDVHAAREEISPAPVHSDMRLSPERRREIFGDLNPEIEVSSEKPKVSWQRRLIQYAAVIVVLFLLAMMAVPSFQKVRSVQYIMTDESRFEAPIEEEVHTFEMRDQNEMTPVRSRADSGERAKQIAPMASYESSPREERASELYLGRAMTESESIDRELAQVEQALAVESSVPWDHIPPEALRLMEKKESLNAQKLSLGGFSGELGAGVGGDGGSFASADYAMSNASGPVDPFAAPAAPTTQPKPTVVNAPGRSSGYAYDAQAAAEPSSDASSMTITAGTPQTFATWRQPEGAIAPAGAPSVVTAPSTGSQLNGWRDESSSASASVDPFAVANTATGVKDSLARGRRQYLNGDYEGAAATFDEVAAQEPDNAEANLFKNKINEMEEYQASGGASQTDEVEALKSFFQNAGIDFDAPGSSLDFDGEKLIVTQSPRNLERMRTVLRKYNEVKQIEVETKYLEVTNVATAPIIYKPSSIVIPKLNFSGMPLSKVVETLSELSAEYDSDRTGVRLDYTPINGEDPRVNLSLRNLNLEQILRFVTEQVNHEYVVMDDRILIQPKGQSSIEQMAQERLKNTAQRAKPEMLASEAPISTFSLNVSDVSFKLAQAALASQRIPDPELIRTEEFVNSFSYGDPAPREDEPVSLNWEIAQHPYAHKRQVVRFSLQTQAAGRAANQALNLNVLLDNSGSMQRPDRRAILEQSLEALQSKLTDQDQLNIILFARQPKLIARAGSRSAQQAAVRDALQYRPEGGTNLEAGLQVAYETAHQHYDPVASNRVILMTDGAANLGDVDASALAAQVVEQRKQGIALDAYGIGWEDYNDAMLEEITRNGDGRYAFLNSIDTAAEDFAEKLAGTLRVAAADVKVQIIWNPERVTTYRQIGYDLHQLKAQDFRDNTVDAAEIGEAEAGTALYVVKINEDPDIVGGLGTLQVRYRVPATGEYVERAWPLEMPRQIPAMQEAPASLRLAAVSAFFAEHLADNPYAANYNFEDLEDLAADLPLTFPAQPRVAELLNMIQSAHALFN